VSDVHVVVPDGIDDPARPSGGNRYDRQVCRGLSTTGWRVREHAVPGSWPDADGAAQAGLAELIAGIPYGAVVVVDGLIGSAVPSVLVPAARRLRLVVLVHMPLGHERECAVLSAASAIITTSTWTRERLLERYQLRPDRVHVAEPGVDGAAIAASTADGCRLLCVAAIAPHKGHDVLLDALARIADLPWRLVCVGALDRDPEFVDRLHGQAEADGIGGRICVTGPLNAGMLDRAYGMADALVLASHAETYGMVVTEALAHGLPVVATAVGGLPDTLGLTADGRRPGLLVPPGDPRALATALGRWLDDADLRQTLRGAALQRRETLLGWPATIERVTDVLNGVAAR
jgi:glycosyltransferase involved in cell wall biosynthesis